MIRKYGAPASSHERRIVAEDVETLGCPLTETEEKDKKKDEPEDDKKD